MEFESEGALEELLCREMQLGDDRCYGAVGEIKVSESVGWWFWVLLIVVLLAVGIGSVWLYRSRMKKEMNKEIKMQVETAVDHYFALTEASVVKNQK